MPARFLALCCLLLGLAAAVASPVFASEPRVALVIGNSDYGPAIGKLLNPANDARLMADTLKGLGFSVDLVLDADQKAMKRAIKSFGAKLEAGGKDATGLFYYAGHGVQVDGTNYLLPVGAEIEREADVEIESIAADDVMTQMQFAGNAVNLVFLDACRNNPLAKANRSGTRGLARLDAPRGSFVGYSTAPGDVAADGDGANSPYALALAEELKRPGISVDEAHRNVRAKVLAATGEKQTPWDSSSLTGPVVLLEQAAPAPQPVAEPAPQPAPTQQASVDKEALFWDSIKASTDPADFQAYLAQFPQGTFTSLARNRIAALTAPAPSAPAQPAAPAPAAAAPPMTFSPAIEAEIADYLTKVDDSTRWSALAIRSDGSAASSVHCNKRGAKVQICIDGIRNNPTTQTQTSKAALKQCGGPGACVLLYEGTNRNPNVGSASTSATPASAVEPSPEPMAASGGGAIVVSAQVGERIDSYLANLTSGKFWALAVRSDGADVTVLGCPKTNPGSAGNWCRAYGSGYLSQEEVNARTLKACGGASKCQLLYEGDRKVLAAEIVTQSQQAIVQPATVLSSDAPAEGSIRVTSEVMAQIQDYLTSATNKAGKFQALAIASDGTNVAQFTCSTSHCPGGSNSNRQEIANKQAVNSCGGYGKCILLYEGDRKVVDAEIVTN